MSTTYYAVRCDDYQRGPFRRREDAERALAGIEKAGNCRLPHEVVECPKSSG